MAEADYFSEDYEATDELVAQALAAGWDIASAPDGVQQTDGLRVYLGKATAIGPEGRTLTRVGAAVEGDAQAPGAPAAESPFVVIARAQRRAERAVARVVLGQSEQGPAQQPDYQKRLQIVIEQAAEAEGVDRERVAEEIRQMFHVASTAELDEGDAAAAMTILARRALRK